MYGWWPIQYSEQISHEQSLTRRWSKTSWVQMVQPWSTVCMRLEISMTQGKWEEHSTLNSFYYLLRNVSCTSENESLYKYGGWLTSMLSMAKGVVQTYQKWKHCTLSYSVYYCTCIHKAIKLCMQASPHDALSICPVQIRAICIDKVLL